jgi:putative endonuclease
MEAKNIAGESVLAYTIVLQELWGGLPCTFMWNKLFPKRKLHLSTVHLQRKVGADGERMATQYLQVIGYELRGTNIRLGKGEIDILAYDPFDKVLVFVEVKSRAHYHEFFRPELNVTARKRSAMKKAARMWVLENEYEGGYRMDLVCIAGGKIINHFKEIGWE